MTIVYLLLVLTCTPADCDPSVVYYADIDECELAARRERSAVCIGPLAFSPEGST